MYNKITNLAILGGSGRMGTSIQSILEKNPYINLNENKHKIILKYLINEKENQYNQITCNNNKHKHNIQNSNKPLSQILKEIDAIIDFSNPKTTINTLKVNKSHKKAFIIGTTGFTKDDYQKIKEYSKIFPILISPNFSIGVNVLFNILKKASKLLSKSNGFSLDISETHHKHKKDFPSGTALKLADIAVSYAGYPNKDYLNNTYQKSISNKVEEYKRKDSDIGISYQRRGEIIGEHEVIFSSNTEEVKLSHKALTRKTFAQGSLVACCYVYSKKPGLYTMDDLIN